MYINYGLGIFYSLGQLRSRMQKTVIEGKNIQEMGKWTEYFNILKIRLTPGVQLSLSCCYIHAYDHNSQTCIMVYFILSSEINVYQKWIKVIFSLQN